MKLKAFFFLASFNLAFGHVRAPSTPQQGQVPNSGISDGHRLITRALWRIFDALMEKKNNEALYGRVSVVEGALNGLISEETKFKRDFSDMKGHIDHYEDQISALKKETEKIKGLENRIRDLEEWQLTMERQNDEEDGSFLKAIQPAFSSCPAPFEAAIGECFYIELDNKSDWRKARRECAQLGGDLASPRDMKQFRNYLRNLPSAKRPEYVWVGLSRTEEDNWVWATGNQLGRPVDMSQEMWNVDLPHGMGDCGGLFELAGYRAYDYKCNEEDNFICQYFF